MKLGYSPHAYHGSIYPFQSLFSSGANLATTPVAMCDAIALWGGTDINPGLYQAEAHPYNGFSPGSLRDQQERVWVEQAIDLGIPIIGICRGAQFICAMAGGKLIQHCTGHDSSHEMTTLDGKVYQTSSSHHQMLYPFDLPKEDYIVLAHSTDNLSTRYDGETIGEQLVPHVEPEVVLFPNIRALAIQGHPEWVDEGSPYVQWCLKQIGELMVKQPVEN